MKTSHLIVNTLLNAGIDKIFSLSGNQIMPVYDAVIDKEIEIIHCRHEAAAVFMADGYAQTSGKIGIALVTAAPGFTNALGPLYAIKSNQSPILLLSGDSPLSHDGLMAFQELNQNEIIRELVKKSKKITQINEIENNIYEAIDLARSGRPGPVHLSLPFDVLNETILKHNPSISTKHKKTDPQLASSTLKKINDIINASKTPLVITGPSLSEARNKILYQKLNKFIKLPIINMSSPRGSNDPSLGNLKTILREADLIITINKDIDFTLGYGSKERISSDKFIFVDYDNGPINHAKKILKERLLLEVKTNPSELLSKLADMNFLNDYTTWINRIKFLSTQRPEKPKSVNKITPYELCNSVVSEAENFSNVIYISDGGEFGQWAQSIIPKSKAITNGPSGAIGGSIPQAIGASFANPDSIVVCFLGDGTAGFQIADWETARRYKLPIIYIIGNDQRWGAEVEIQIRDYGEDRAKYCMLDNETNYASVASGLGCKGFKVSSIKELKKIIKAAFSLKETTIIDVNIEGLPGPTL